MIGQSSESLGYRQRSIWATADDRRPLDTADNLLAHEAQPCAKEPAPCALCSLPRSRAPCSRHA